MILKLIFKQLPTAKQAAFMKSRGIVLGTRKKDGREAYLYMVNNLFAEILYENDNPKMTVERLVILDGLQKFNSHLEKDMR